MDYRSAGVNISKNDRLIARIKKMMGKAGSSIGHFGGAFSFSTKDYKEPLLVSSIDSAGTKTAVAIAVNKHDGIGRDILHHSINDIACCGAEPLYFLDYIAMSNLDEEIAASLIQGMIESGQRWDVKLAGGELAEMPGVYQQNEYDLVISINGVVEKSEYINGSGIKNDDILIGFPSAGLHTNGYSLARKVVEQTEYSYSTLIPGQDTNIGDALLAEHRCYLDEIRELKQNYRVKGLAHITGGGLPGNVSRIVPSGFEIEFDWGSWIEPPVFNLLREAGEIPEDDMRSTFNLGVGLVAVLNPDFAKEVFNNFPKHLYKPFAIGRVVNKG
ncbi:phosphoribosylformylglycinamidine cyclo-ligase [bacterium]|nr:phosphoribosylformylglycinamidine cyclo-ligase [bacterium]